MDNRVMIVLSIDPSSIAIGWALFSAYQNGIKGLKVLDYGTVRPKSKKNENDKDARFLQRLQDISKKIIKPYDDKTITPDYVLIEKPYLGPMSNPKAILQLGTAIGVIISQFPNSLIVMVKGHKTKAKAQLFCDQLGIGKSSNDCRDAVSMGWYWINKNGLMLYAEVNQIKP